MIRASLLNLSQPSVQLYLRVPVLYNVHTSLHDDVMFSFVAVDATPKPGPKKVFNFLGQLTEDEVMDSGQHWVKLRKIMIESWMTSIEWINA